MQVGDWVRLATNGAKKGTKGIVTSIVDTRVHWVRESSEQEATHSASLLEVVAPPKLCFRWDLSDESVVSVTQSQLLVRRIDWLQVQNGVTCCKYTSATPLGGLKNGGVYYVQRVPCDEANAEAYAVDLWTKEYTDDDDDDNAEEEQQPGCIGKDVFHRVQMTALAKGTSHCFRPAPKGEASYRHVASITRASYASPPRSAPNPEYKEKLMRLPTEKRSVYMRAVTVWATSKALRNIADDKIAVLNKQHDAVTRALVERMEERNTLTQQMQDAKIVQDTATKGSRVDADNVADVDKGKDVEVIPPVATAKEEENDDARATLQRIRKLAATGGRSAMANELGVAKSTLGDWLTKDTVTPLMVATFSKWTGRASKAAVTSWLPDPHLNSPLFRQREFVLPDGYTADTGVADTGVVDTDLMQRVRDRVKVHTKTQVADELGIGRTTLTEWLDRDTPTPMMNEVLRSWQPPTDVDRSTTAAPPRPNPFGARVEDRGNKVDSIRRILQAGRCTHKSLAGHLGVGDSTLRDWLRPTSTPSALMVQTLEAWDGKSYGQTAPTKRKAKNGGDDRPSKAARTTPSPAHSTTDWAPLEELRDVAESGTYTYLELARQLGVGNKSTVSDWVNKSYAAMTPSMKEKLLPWFARRSAK